MIQNKKYSFTLIEVLICLLLLSMSGSMVIYKGWKMLQEHRFSTSCEKIASEIQLTKGLAIAYQMDIYLILEQRGSQVFVTRVTDFAPEGIKVLFQKANVLSEIAFRQDDGVKEMQFYGNGWIESDKKITFFMPKHVKKEYSVVIKQSFRMAV